MYRFSLWPAIGNFNNSLQPCNLKLTGAHADANGWNKYTLFEVIRRDLDKIIYLSIFHRSLLDKNYGDLFRKSVERIYLNNKALSFLRNAKPFSLLHFLFGRFPWSLILLKAWNYLWNLQLAYPRNWRNVIYKSILPPTRSC